MKGFLKIQSTDQQLNCLEQHGDICALLESDAAVPGEVLETPPVAESGNATPNLNAAAADAEYENATIELCAALGVQ